MKLAQLAILMRSPVVCLEVAHRVLHLVITFCQRYVGNKQGAGNCTKRLCGSGNGLGVAGMVQLLSRSESSTLFDRSEDRLR